LAVFRQDAVRDRRTPGSARKFGAGLDREQVEELRADRPRQVRKPSTMAVVISARWMFALGGLECSANGVPSLRLRSGGRGVWVPRLRTSR